MASNKKKVNFDRSNTCIDQHFLMKASKMISNESFANKRYFDNVITLSDVTPDRGLC